MLNHVSKRAPEYHMMYRLPRILLSVLYSLVCIEPHSNKIDWEILFANYAIKPSQNTDF